MIATLIGTLFLAGLLWVLLRLRDLRERALDDELPGDAATVMLGMYLTLSKACLQYHRDHGRYPTRVSGAPEDALAEAGYLDGEPLSRLSDVLHRFSLVATESSGSAICLFSTPSNLASEIISRVDEMEGQFMFLDMRGAQFRPLTLPISTPNVNLCLLLPVQPAKLPEP